MCFPGLKKTCTKPFVDDDGKIIKNSVAKIEYLSLGGVKQSTQCLKDQKNLMRR